MFLSPDRAAGLFITKGRGSSGYDFAAAFVIIAALIFHIYLVASGYPQTNSDESTMGLMARHILYQGKPVFMFYGQDYMGSIEAYLGAFFFLLFGPSIFALRMGVILEFVLFLVCLYVLSCLLYSRKIGLLSLLIGCAGPSELLFGHVVAAGGPMEVLLFGVLLALIAVRLVLSYGQGTLSRRRRLWLYGVWGLLAGLAIWSDPLVLPFVAMPGLLLLVFCWREVRGKLFALIVCCVLIGFSPYLFFWLTVPVEQVQSHLLPWPSLAKPTPTHTTAPVKSQVMVSLKPRMVVLAHNVPPQWVGDYGQAVPAPSLSQRVLGMLVIALPLATGGSQLCAVYSHEAWPVTAGSSPHLLQCTVVHGLWGLGHILFWAIAVWLAWCSVRFYWRAAVGSADERSRDVVLHVCRLMLLVGAGLSLLLYTVSQAPAIVPWSSSRYLVGLHIATPAVLAGLWEVTAGVKRRLFVRVLLRVVRYGLLLLVLGVLWFGSWGVLSQLPSIRKDVASDAVFIAWMEQQGIRTFYSDYWTCNHMIFLSEERLTCSVLDERLQPGLDRYLPYRAIVQGDRHAAYIFKVGSPQARAFAERVVSGSGMGYRSEIVEGYVVYESR